MVRRRIAWAVVAVALIAMALLALADSANRVPGGGEHGRSDTEMGSARGAGEGPGAAPDTSGGSLME
jgi:hypothetical protein